MCSWQIRTVRPTYTMTLKSDLADLDEMGIDVQAVSVNPFWYWADVDLARKVIQIQNEKIAELCAAHPKRFAGLGSVALQHPSLAVEQMEDGVKNLGMRGFAIGGSVNGDDLSAPKFHPFWAKAEELQTLIFIHPQSAGAPIDEKRLRGNGFLDNVVGHPLETTLALTHLIQDGTLDLFPRFENLRGARRRLPAILLEPERSVPDCVSQSLQASEEASHLNILNNYIMIQYYFTPEDIRRGLIAGWRQSRSLWGPTIPRCGIALRWTGFSPFLD